MSVVACPRCGGCGQVVVTTLTAHQRRYRERRKAGIPPKPISENHRAALVENRKKALEAKRAIAVKRDAKRKRISKLKVQLTDAYVKYARRLPANTPAELVEAFRSQMKTKRKIMEIKLNEN